MIVKFKQSFTEPKTNNIIVEKVIGNLDKIYQKESTTPAELNTVEIYFSIGSTDYQLSKIRYLEIIKDENTRYYIEKKQDSVGVYDVNGQFIEYSKLYEELEKIFLGI